MYFVGKFLLFLNSFQKTLKTKQKDVFSAGLRMVVQVVPIFNTRDPLCGGQKGNQNILWVNILPQNRESLSIQGSSLWNVLSLTLPSACLVGETAVEWCQAARNFLTN